MNSTILSNDNLSVTIKHLGAEITNIQTNDGLELIWQAHPKIWARHAPILFPIVGKLKNDQYKCNGKIYQMTQHGFARDLSFIQTASNHNSVTFQLVENSQTLAIFPFHFLLEINYILIGYKLTINYTVKNTGQTILPFSIGAHPGFSCPHRADENYDDYYLEFEQEEELIHHKLTQGLRSGDTGQPLKSKYIHLSTSLFDEDALIFNTLKSKYIQLKNRQGNFTLEVGIEGWPWLGIWSKPNAPFVCIEPWHGITDIANTSGEFNDKEGLLFLKPDEEFKCEYYIELLAH
jgi:galactose mutarotase-like enzyme